MADVLADLKNWSATASSNLPAGTTAIGTGLDDNLRQLQATVRQDLASVGANIASAGTCDLGAVAGLFHTITGTTTITSFGTVAAGIWKVLTFSGALTITHNGTSLICPYSANITTTANDTLLAESLGSGNWKIHPFHVATLYAALSGSASQAFNTAALTASGVVTVTAGSAAAPAITTAGDTNCGIFFPAADTVAVATAGTERMRIDASGNVGIGVASDANTRLYVVSGAGKSAALIAGPAANILVDYLGGGVNYIGASSTVFRNPGGTVNCFNVSQGSGVTVVEPVGLGYGTGAGGTVTQTTSKTTAVTLNKPTGTVTMHNASLAAGATAQFTINNTLAALGDTATAGRGNGGSNLSYRIEVEGVYSQQIVVNVTNITAGSLSEAVPVVFNLHKGASA